MMGEQCVCDKCGSKLIEHLVYYSNKKCAYIHGWRCLQCGDKWGLYFEEE